MISWNIQYKKDGEANARGTYVAGSTRNEYLVECFGDTLNATATRFYWSVWLFGENWSVVVPAQWMEIEQPKYLRQFFPELLVHFENQIISPMNRLAETLE